MAPWEEVEKIKCYQVGGMVADLSKSVFCPDEIGFICFDERVIDQLF